MFQHNVGRLVTGDDDKENARLIVLEHQPPPESNPGLIVPECSVVLDALSALRTEDKTMTHKWGEHP